MDRARYFDNAATTPLDPRVLAAMRPWMEDEWANAHSLHTAGRKARGAVENARALVASLVGAEDPAQIFFTSGATEGANAIIAGQTSAGWISPFEHSAVRTPALARGWRVAASDGWTIAPQDGFGAVMAVNNETGAILNTAAASLVDATQALGKTPWNVGEAEYALGSAHKIYGPKGVGFLYARDGLFPPLLLGGEQEGGMRGGTLNVAGIVGLGEAARIAAQEDGTDLARSVREAILNELPDARVNADGAPHILSVSFEGIEAETILLDLDRAGFAVSAGAACSSSSAEPSPTLTALGLDPAWLRGTVRASSGRFSTVEAAAALGREMNRISNALRNEKP